jgi:hypothetical protein
MAIGPALARGHPADSEARLTHGPHRHHEAAFEAIAATPPLGSVGYEAEANKRGERTPFSLIHERPFEAAIFPGRQWPLTTC